MPKTSCNLIFKGGVSSGLVYARMLLKFNETYRFRGLAGASAGAIAATFAAAAEHGGDGGFTRLEQRAETLMQRLRGLFVASPPFRPLLEATFRLAPGSGTADYAGALACFAPAALLGGGTGITLLAAVYLVMDIAVWTWAIPAFMLAAMLGALTGFVAHLAALVTLAATRYNFGICSGLDLTRWLHEAVQDIAGEDRPLTFAMLTHAGIDLRMVASHISLARPVFLPDLEHPLWFDPAEWDRLFPAKIMACLRAGVPDAEAALWPLPTDLPVIVALRMSLACPGLFEQVPVYAEPLPAPDPARRLYLGDGGLTVNFPFDIFAGCGHPTLAFDLETLEPDETRRVWRIDDEAGWPVRFTQLPGPLAFCWSLFRNMREGQNRAASRRPHDNIHVFRIGLKSTEGGMNLNMTAAQAEALMMLGVEAGDEILRRMEET